MGEEGEGVAATNALVLCYHNIVPDSTPAELLESLLAVRHSQFVSHMRFMAARYAFATFEDVEAGGRSRRDLILTFDDGYRGVLDFALPLLRQYHIPAYIFVNPAFVGGWSPRDKLMALTLYGSAEATRRVEEFLGAPLSGDGVRARASRFVELRGVMWEAVGRGGGSSIQEIERLFNAHADERVRSQMGHSGLLSWDDLAMLRRHGCRVGNHTYRHLELDLLPRELIRQEVRDAQRMLQQHLGADEPVISYPRGKSTLTVEEEVRSAGYRWGLLATPGRLTSATPTLEARRVVVAPEDGPRRLIWKASRARIWARRRLKGPLGRAIRGGAFRLC